MDVSEVKDGTTRGWHSSDQLTVAEEILARASGSDRVRAGEYVVARVDAMMMHDIFAADVLSMLEKAGIRRLHDPSKVTVVFDHMVPSPSVSSSAHQAKARELIRYYAIDAFFEVGRGICHQVMIEENRVAPGQLVVGTDSHTTTYGALGVASSGIGSSEMAYTLATGQLWFKVPESVSVVLEGEFSVGVSAKDLILRLMKVIGSSEAQYRSVEFGGPGVGELDLADRMTVSNMGVEMGAKFTIFPEGPVRTVKQGASYVASHTIALGSLAPQIAVPHHVENVVDVDEVVGVPLDQVFIGSCTNGRLKDLRIAASVLKGRHIAKGLRLIVTPASARVMEAAAREGIIEDLVRAGAYVGGPGCGPCFGGHMGLLAPGERCLGTHNRNFRGRMGSGDAEIYLGSPLTAAVSALAGAIADPREVVQGSLGEPIGVPDIGSGR
ncbi:MAG: 3-isopropylmalate dehydratase large subunit [Acidimicrobiaceae bacterium]|nr:3-isopropylmalate dehydratase large subunit [Acidimicrobiaceae bacterium]